MFPSADHRCSSSSSSSDNTFMRINDKIPSLHNQTSCMIEYWFVKKKQSMHMYVCMHADIHTHIHYGASTPWWYCRKRGHHDILQILGISDWAELISTPSLNHMNRWWQMHRDNKHSGHTGLGPSQMPRKLSRGCRLFLV